MDVRRVIRTSVIILAARPVRTSLAPGAILTGVAALVLMLGSAASAERDLQDQLRAMGSRTLIVRAGRSENIGGRKRQLVRTNSLTLRDARVLRDGLSGETRVAALAVNVLRGGEPGRLVDLRVAGVDPNIFDIYPPTISVGRLVSSEDEREQARDAVLRRDAALGIFGPREAVGERLRIAGANFRVIGVAEFSGYLLGSTTTQPLVVVPLRTLVRRVAPRNFVDAIVVQAARGQALADVSREITELLRASHRLGAGAPPDFEIIDPSVLIKEEHEVGRTFRTVAAGVSALSFLMGGVGVLTLMLLGVRERTREIGVRRAAGASRRDIAAQFLCEALLLSAAGALGGAAVGLPLLWLVSRTAGWQVVWPMWGTLLAVGVGFVVGSIAGVAPAVRAAHLEPSQALRASA